MSAPARLALAVAAAAVLGATFAARAHHAFSAEFDASKPVALRGTVTKVELINPHSWIHIDVKDDAGRVTSWMIEGGSPNALFKRGITRTSVPIGAELVISGYQARDGAPRAVGRDITFADGRALFFTGTPVPPAN